MDESRSFLRPGAPLPIASFMPAAPALVLVEEAPVPPLPTPLPLRANPQFASEVAVPRRAVRQFAESHYNQKRMRPCFYSPIQCLMKRSAAGEEQPETVDDNKKNSAD